MVIIAVLAAVAVPSYLGQIRKSRRAEAVTFMSQVQQAQERYRANRTTYADNFIVVSGGLTGVGASTDTNATTSYATSGGYYVLSLLGLGPSENQYGVGYTVRATAQGEQTKDGLCKFMQMTLAGGNITYNSGATSGTSNGATSSANIRCWNR
jgi:type IV pilus assembly protein PilE